MKKFLLLLLCTIVFGLGINSDALAKDVVPVRPDITHVTSIGLYQVGDDVVVYSEPDENSQILYRVRWNSDEFFPEEIGFDKFFEVFLPKKNMALVRVNDYLDDWVEIIYDKTNNKTGWIKKDDPYKFMTWVNFYNVYGKKYGLTLLKSAPDSCLDIKAGMEDSSKTISTINHPQQINLNVIRGNWALVSVLDLDKAPKTGYIRWRSDDGVRYFFPSVR